MRIKLLLAMLVLLVVAVFPSRASAQVGIWLQRGTSGFGADVTVASGGGATTYGVAGGYSFRGIVDVGLGFLHHSYDRENFNGYSVSANGIAPGVQVHPLKQGPTMPVSVSLGAGFEKFFFSSSELDDAGIELDAWTLTVSASVYRFFRLGENIGVIPSAGIGLVHSNVGSNVADDQTSDDLAVQLSGNFAYLSGTTIFGLTPFLVIGDDTVLGLNFQVVFSQPGS